MKKLGWQLLSIPFIILVWYAFSRGYSELVFPGPIPVFQEFFKQLGTVDFYHHIGISLYRLFCGFILASVGAFVIGTLAGFSAPFRLFLSPMVSFFQATPPMAWAPLLILLLQLGDGPMIAVIIIAAFFPILVSVMHGMEQVKTSYIRVAQSLGANKFQLLRFVYLPSILPSAMNGLIIGFGIAWRSLVAAEMIGGNSGLGWLISSSGQVGNSSLVLVGIITIGLLALIFEFILIRPLKKRFASWSSES
jgi:NitT/TauT family transport system permease protein/taurine transport system permease protein